MLLYTRFALQSRFKSSRQAPVAHAWRAVATADRHRHCVAAQREYRERAVAAAWCGGSEVRINSAASPKCGLLNQATPGQQVASVFDSEVRK
jgi:hypothetical protein